MTFLPSLLIRCRQFWFDHIYHPGIADIRVQFLGPIPKCAELDKVRADFARRTT